MAGFFAGKAAKEKSTAQSQTRSQDSARQSNALELETEMMFLQRNVGNRALGQILQRKCRTCAASGTKCAHCKEEDEQMLQRKSDGTVSSTQKSGVPPIVHSVLNSSGQPLDPAPRSFMESRFGHDFSQVRIHTDAKAAESARAVNAHVYTVGQDVVFDAGQYMPETIQGKQLLAHELTHVVQQKSSVRTLQSNLKVGQVGDAYEKEAERISAAVLSDTPMQVRPGLIAPRIQRVPWGTCPSGRRLSAAHPFRYGAAEVFAEGRFRLARSGSCIVSNVQRLEEMTCPREPERTIIRQMQERFRSGRNPRRTREIHSAEGVPAPEEGTSVSERLEGAASATVEAFSLLRPDMLDLTRREVYDVTTLSQARGHENIVREYAQLLNRITNFHWNPGTTYGPIRPLTYPIRPTESVCYGPTDFARWPGVILYEVIATRGKPRPPDEEQRRRGQQRQRRPGTAETEQTRPRRQVRDPEGLRTAERQAAQRARQVEQQAAQALQQRLAREVSVEAAQSRIRRLLQSRIPRILAARVTRIAATRTARRAFSMIPVLGWGFAAVDVYNAVRDIARGHVARGLAGVGCAAVDVGADLLHLADVVTGPGGTAASLAVQAGTIACQIGIEVARANEKMEELKQEIARTNNLPTVARLRDYYELDDEAISELRREFGLPEETGGPIPQISNVCPTCHPRRQERQAEFSQFPEFDIGETGPETRPEQMRNLQEWIQNVQQEE